MKKTIFPLFMLLICIQVQAEKSAEFPALTRPTFMAVDGDSLYMIEGSNKVSVYSRKDHKFIRTIGRKGEGPGEFRRTPYLKILPDSLFFGTFEKFTRYSKQGEMLDEKKQLASARLLPVSENYVQLGTKFEGEIRFRTVDLLGPDLGKLGELDSLILLDTRKRGAILAIRDYLGIDTYEDKIFVVNTKKGFTIAVFDKTGKELYCIVKQKAEIPVTKEYRDEFATQISQHPQMGEWRAALERWKIEYPKFFPAIRNFTVSDERLYIETFSTKEDDVEFLILDLEGNTLHEGYFPVHEEQNLVDRYPYTFSTEAYYYLKYNLGSNVWELHKIPY